MLPPGPNHLACSTKASNSSGKTIGRVVASKTAQVEYLALSSDPNVFLNTASGETLKHIDECDVQHYMLLTHQKCANVESHAMNEWISSSVECKNFSDISDWNVFS